MSEAYMKYVLTMHSFFEKKFVETYQVSNAKKRRKVLPYLHALYRRWYYATLVEHTPFSPANLMEAICAHFEEPTGLYPCPTLRTPTRVSGVDMQILSYTAEAHPVVADMRRLMEYCSPHVDLCEEECFTDAQALEVAELLSMNDPHYASFLLELAIQMKLLTKMPSLYVQRMQLGKKCEELLGLSDAELLHDIVNASIQMAAMGLRNSMPMPEHIFTEAFIRTLLTTPLETDEIFGRVFQIMGYDIEDLLKLSNEPMPSPESFLDPDMYDMELLSGTFVLGIVLDRFFFTPFGHFLRLIRPLYELPFEMEEEVSEYIKVCDDPQEAFVAFFAPCSSYTLTKLGLDILDIAPTPENYYDMSELPFEAMKDSLFADGDAFETFVALARHLSPLAFENKWGDIPQEIYTFRVRSESTPSVWLHLQMPDNADLRNLYEECVRYFEIKPNEEYSIFHDKTENRFAEYPSDKRASRAKKPRTTASQMKLSELDFEKMKNLIIVAHNQATPFAGEASVARLQIELLNKTDPNPQEFYPRISRMSKDMRFQAAALMDDEDEDFWDFPMF